MKKTDFLLRKLIQKITPSDYLLLFSGFDYPFIVKELEEVPEEFSYGIKVISTDSQESFQLGIKGWVGLEGLKGFIKEGSFRVSVESSNTVYSVLGLENSITFPIKVGKIEIPKEDALHFVGNRAFKRFFKRKYSKPYLDLIYESKHGIEGSIVAKEIYNKAKDLGW